MGGGGIIGSSIGSIIGSLDKSDSDYNDSHVIVLYVTKCKLQFFIDHVIKCQIKSKHLTDLSATRIFGMLLTQIYDYM